MKKKVLIFVIILMALLAIFFAYNYFTESVTNAPAANNSGIRQNGGFQGPAGEPSVKGPSSPPPGN